MFHVSREKKTKTGQTKINKQKRAGLDPSQCDLRFKYSLVWPWFDDLNKK